MHKSLLHPASLFLPWVVTVVASRLRKYFTRVPDSRNLPYDARTFRSTDDSRGASTEWGKKIRLIPGTTERGRLKDSMRPHLGYLHYANARVLHYVSAPRAGRWITLMSRGRFGPPGRKSDLYTNMSALVAAKSPGFKGEIRLASIAGGWSGRQARSAAEHIDGENPTALRQLVLVARRAEIFNTIHFRCLHYVAFAYRPFEWLFHRSGNYSRGALPDGSNFFSRPRF